MGDFTTEEHYRYGWWQDGATYSKYTYKSVNLNNEYLAFCIAARNRSYPQNIPQE